MVKFIKNLKLNLFIFVVLVAAIAGWILVFQKNRQIDDLISQSSEIQKIQQKPKELNTYINNRFGYAIDYPKNWPVGEEATNNDGRNLYNTPETEILVYGSNIPSSFSTQDTPVERGIVELMDGRKATQLKLTDEEGKIRYIVFFEQNEVQYAFFARVTQDFFKQHEKDIISTAKSLRLLK